MNSFIRLGIVFCSLSLFHACNHEPVKRNPAKDFGNLDTYLRTRDFDRDSLRHYLEAIDQGLIHSERRQTGYAKKQTIVNYKWNSDSTLTLIRAHKTFSKGFSREVILHSGDSILLIHRFTTEPLSLENYDHTFLESIIYLQQAGTIRHLARIEYNKKDLKDTVQFRKKPFTDLTDNVSHYYSLELNYIKNISGL